MIADANGGLAYGCLKYLDWLALQLLPDTAETEWLDRQGNIWLTNSDGSKGRKGPTAATGSATISGTPGSILPFGSLFTVTGGPGRLQSYQTTATVVIGDGPTPLPLTCMQGGVIGNLLPGDQIRYTGTMPGLLLAVVVSMQGGTDQETDDELRVRVLQRIQQPPMGGDAADYVSWAYEFPGVTRAWCSPLEMGVGTTTLRFMMDDLRAASGGFPNLQDAANLMTFMNTVRPVTVMDLFVVAPIPQPVSFKLNNLTNDDSGTIENINLAVQDMFKRKAAPAYAKDGIAQPAQTIYAAWVSEAVMSASGVQSFDLVMDDAVPANKGSICVLGNIIV